MESNKNEWRNQMESNILTHGGIKWNQIFSTQNQMERMEESNGIKYFDTWRNQMESNKNEWRNQMESNILTHGGIKWNQIF